MKNIFIVLALVLTSVVSAQQVNWVSLEEAVAFQKKNPKKIIMDVYTSWCGPCKMLDRNTFQNKDVAAYINENYYAVKFNAEGEKAVTFNGKTYTNPNYNPAKAKRRNSQHQLAAFYNVRAYPTIIFLNEKSETITSLTSYKTPQQLELYLKMFKKDDHLDIKTQEEFNTFYKAFKHEFKE